jgi:hypothetical protein
MVSDEGRMRFEVISLEAMSPPLVWWSCLRADICDERPFGNSGVGWRYSVE